LKGGFDSRTLPREVGRGYGLKDCVAATSQAEHENAITYDFPRLSLPVSADSVIAALAPSASNAA